jgi:hypothetical protein
MNSREVLDRIAALIALASSPEKEEARSAAHKACAMMREYGAVIAFEEDGALVSRPVAVRAPDSRAGARRTPEHKTVIVFRCSHCGRRLPRAGAPCQACEQLKVPIGIWTVDCQGCGRSSPPGRSEVEVNEIAYRLGFVVTDDGRTLCPMCARPHRSATG